MRKLKFEIENIEGIHIGVAMDHYEKGNIDSYTIKDKNGYPYIPATSIKGKFRYFLDNISMFCEEDFIEKINKKLNLKIQKDQKDEKLSNLLFGNHQKDGSNSSFEFNEMKKVLFKDATLKGKYDNQLELKDYSNFFEIKAENSIDLEEVSQDIQKIIEVKSNPRMIERTVPNLKYNFEIILVGFEHEDLIEEIIVKTFEYLSEFGYIGGNGTRGYGKVKITKEEN